MVGASTRPIRAVPGCNGRNDLVPLSSCRGPVFLVRRDISPDNRTASSPPPIRRLILTEELRHGIRLSQPVTGGMAVTTCAESNKMTSALGRSPSRLLTSTYADNRNCGEKTGNTPCIERESQLAATGGV